MRSVARSMVLVFTLAALPAFAADGAPLSKALLDPYLEITEAFADDSIDQLAARRDRLAEAARKDGRKELAALVEKVTTSELKAARQSFKPVSEAIVAVQRKSPAEGVSIYYCPMARAHWLQRADPLANPFHGSEMLRCGRKVK